MTKEERLKVYDEAVEIWGIDQGQAEIENNLVEEIADVFICIEEMINLFGEDKVNAAIEQKMQKFKNEIKEIKK